MTESDPVRHYREILARCEKIFVDRCERYSQVPFENLRRSTNVGVPPSTNVLLRMGDKFSRLEQAARTGLGPEMILDDIADLVNYAVIHLILKQEEAVEPKPKFEGLTWTIDPPAIDEPRPDGHRVSYRKSSSPNT